MTQKNIGIVLWIVGILIAVIIFKPDIVKDVQESLTLFSSYSPGEVEIILDTDDYLKVKEVSKPICGYPAGKGQQNQYLKTYALFLDDEPYYCEENYLRRGWSDFYNTFVCNKKRLPWYNREGQQLWSVYEYSPHWGYDIGEPQPFKIKKSGLIGEHKVIAYNLLCCPNMQKDSDGYFEECTIHKMEKTIDFGEIPGYVILDNECVFVSKKAVYSTLSECESNLIQEEPGYIIENNECIYVTESPDYLTLSKCEENIITYECLTDSDCPQDTCFGFKCSDGKCIPTPGLTPPPCSEAVWQGYPNCRWDTSLCLICPAIVGYKLENNKCVYTTDGCEVEYSTLEECEENIITYECLTDSDCLEGFECRDNVCIEKEEIPKTVWYIIAGLVGFALLRVFL